MRVAQEGMEVQEEAALYLCEMTKIFFQFLIKRPMTLFM